MAEIKYQYAYDEKGLLVNINELSVEDRNAHTYRCIGCGNQLMPRAIGSKYRKPHFYHKVMVDCNGETYLHKLSKRFIKERFEQSQQFLISFPTKVECNVEDCALRNINCTKEEFEHNEQIDLRKYYDTIEEEVQVDGFVADLLLSNSKNPKLPPILIEICVTHPCDDAKRKSGLKIIELKIKSETDLQEIFRNNVIREDFYDHYKQVEFISFRRHIRRKFEAKIYRFILNKLSRSGYMTHTLCTSAKKMLRQDSSKELNVACRTREDDIPVIYPYMWLYRRYGSRSCAICKFYHCGMFDAVPECKYNAKYGLNPYPEMDYAERCRVFSANANIDLKDYYIEEVFLRDNEAKPEYKVIIAGSSYICGDYNLFKANCLKYLSKKMQTHNVVIISGTSQDIEDMTKNFAFEFNLTIQPHKALWFERDDAAFVSNREMVDYADALIVFWNHRSRYMSHLIECARQKGIRVAEITM